MVAPRLRVGAPTRLAPVEIEGSPSTSHDIGWFEAWDSPVSKRERIRRRGHGGR